jgi:hypothetical protein
LINAIHSHTVSTIIDPGGIERRKLRAELAQLGQLIEENRLYDWLTSSIANWHTAFSKALDEHPDPEVVRKRFIPLLREKILRDTTPLHHYPLDEETYFCSDRTWIGHKVLCCQMNQMGNVPFTVTPHPLARAMVRWSAKQGYPVTTPPESERLYNALERQSLLPILPSENADPILAEIFKANQARAQRLQVLLKQREQLLVALQAEAAAFHKEVEKLRERNIELQSQLDNMGSQVDELTRATARLEIAINEVSASIAERNAKGAEGLGVAIGTIAICCVASFALSQLQFSLGMTLRTAPSVGGGASVQATIFL